MKHIGLFLDRDGVINHDPGDYTCSLKEFHLLPNVWECIRMANQKDAKVILITNQAGIAKGRYAQAQVLEINEFLYREADKHGVEITDIFWSPYHSEISASLSRKPNSLLIEKALYKHQINPEKSLMIGDKMRDIEAAEKVGVAGQLIEVNTSFKSIIESWNP